MFLTYDSSKSKPASDLVGFGRHIWDEVELTSSKLWFIVEVDTWITGCTEPSTYRRTLLITDFETIERLLTSASHQLTKISALYVVNPSPNSTDQTWSLHKISTIWNAIAKEGVKNVYEVFESIDGQWLVDQFDFTSINKLELVSVKFKLGH
jgi:hypothetical protein